MVKCVHVVGILSLVELEMLDVDGTTATTAPWIQGHGSWVLLQDGLLQVWVVVPAGYNDGIMT
jgi:hypothetical protein